MNRHPLEFRCDVCRRLVDGDTRDRARHAWQPLIICEGCIRDPGEPVSARIPLILARAAR